MEEEACLRAIPMISFTSVGMKGEQKRVIEVRQYFGFCFLMCLGRASFLFEVLLYITFLNTGKFTLGKNK